jgi:peptidoglycan/LPS O-acetylase OafA/YrhL
LIESGAAAPLPRHAEQPVPRASERIFGLDLLRCVAILMVLVGHARFFLRPMFPASQSFSVLGFLGVELFFVLSGFLIGGIILRSFGDAPSGATLRGFWVRRWFRTLPNYYLFLLVNLLLPQTEPIRDVGRYLLFLQNLAWRAGLFFNESWSLAVEEWFYLLFPILLILASRVWPRQRVAVAVSLGLLFAAATAARVYAGATHAAWDTDVRKVVAYRLDALMVGVLAAFLKTWRPASWLRWRRAGVAVGSILFVATVALYFALDRNASFFAKTFYFTLTSASVFCLLPALDAWRDAQGRLARGVENISLWSYSLYLCQLPVSVLLLSAFGDPETLGPQAGVLRVLGLTSAFLAGSVAVSAVVYRWFERPAMNLRERFS